MFSKHSLYFLGPLKLVINKTNNKLSSTNIFLNFSFLFDSFFPLDNNFICDCRLQWLYELKNRTRYPQLRDSLENFVCNLQEPHLHNFIEPIPNHVLQLLNVGGINAALTSNDQFMGTSAGTKKRPAKNRQAAQRRNKFEGQIQLAGEGQEQELENSASLKKKRALTLQQYQGVGSVDTSSSSSSSTKTSSSSNAPVESHYIFGGPDSNSGMHNDYFDANSELLLTHPVKMEDELEMMKQNALFSQNNDVLTASQNNHLENVDLMPKQVLAIPVRLFLLKPERLPCHEELSDPTELPLSRDLMDARSSNVHVLTAADSAASRTQHSFNILYLLILALVYGTQVG